MDERERKLCNERECKHRFSHEHKRECDCENANNYFIVANNVKLGKCQIMAKKLSQDCR